MKRNVFVIGGSSGIGKAVIERFLKDGDYVTNLSRTPCDNPKVYNVLCDVNDKLHYFEELERFKKTNAGLDVFVYSAGFSMASPLEFIEKSDCRYLFEVNFFGFIEGLQAVLPLLRQRQGVACVVSSIGGVQPIYYDCLYSASKAAVNMLVNALQAELLPKGVKVLSVMPGGTKTDFTFKRKVYPNEKVGDYAVSMDNAVKALKKIEQNGMSPESVAAVIFDKCTSSVISHTYSAGLINKAATLSTKILPQCFLYSVGSKIFGTEEND